MLRLLHDDTPLHRPAALAMVAVLLTIMRVAHLRLAAAVMGPMAAVAFVRRGEL
jgi:hypothetical protein